MCDIYLIRHGQSEANAGKPTIDSALVPLTTLGEWQAGAAANYLQKKANLQRLITSPYERAKQTAWYTNQYFPNVEPQEKPIQEFTYLSSVHEEYSTTADRRPLVEAYWEQLLPDYQDGPQSESFIDFIARVRLFLEYVLKMRGEQVAIFSHEQFITAMLWLLERGDVNERLQASMRDFHQYFRSHPIPNGAIVRLLKRSPRWPTFKKQTPSSSISLLPRPEISDYWLRTLVTQHL